MSKVTDVKSPVTDAKLPVNDVLSTPIKAIKSTSKLDLIKQASTDPSRSVPKEPEQTPPESISKLAEMCDKSISGPDDDSVAVYVANIDILLGRSDIHPSGAAVPSGTVVSEVVLSSVEVSEGKTMLARLLEIQKTGTPTLTQIGDVSVTAYSKTGEVGVINKFKNRVAVNE